MTHVHVVAPAFDKSISAGPSAPRIVPRRRRSRASGSAAQLVAGPFAIGGHFRRRRSRVLSPTGLAAMAWIVNNPGLRNNAARGAPADCPWPDYREIGFQRPRQSARCNCSTVLRSRLPCAASCTNACLNVYIASGGDAPLEDELGGDQTSESRLQFIRCQTGDFP